MNFKIILFISCLVYCANSQIAKFTKIEVEKEPFDQSPESYVNFVATITVIADDADLFSFNVAFDTTSNLTFVSSEYCLSKYCPATGEPPVPVHGNKSSEYGITGWLHTYLVYVGLNGYNGPTADLNLYNADFVSKNVGKKLARKQVNGVLGLQKTMQALYKVQNTLGFCTSKSCGGLYTEIPKGLIKQDPTKDPRSSINLDSSSSGLKFNINYIRNSKGEWKTWCFEGCSAVVDVMLNGISGPKDDIKSINEYIGADKDGNIECYKARHLEPINFYIDSNRYALKASNYIIKSDDKFSPKCKSAFVPNQSNDELWNIGVPMLDQYLSVIDFNSNQLIFYELAD